MTLRVKKSSVAQAKELTFEVVVSSKEDNDAT